MKFGTNAIPVLRNFGKLHVNSIPVLDAGTRHIGMRGKESIPVPDASVCSVKSRYRYPTDG